MDSDLHHPRRMHEPLCKQLQTDAHLSGARQPRTRQDSSHRQIEIASRWPLTSVVSSFTTCFASPNTMSVFGL